jgi:hypothetical protein
MNTIISKSFSNELEKISTVGIVGDVLAAGLLGSILMTGMQHGKGFKEALRAGAKFKQAIGSDPLPIGKQWKFKPISQTGGNLEINTEGMHNPYKETTPYEFKLGQQEKKARNIAGPLGALAYTTTNRSSDRR